MNQTRPKYGNRRTELDGIAFASAAEARRYQALRLMATVGAISELELQPSFVLQDAFTDRDGKRWPAIRYRGDFSYREPGNPRVVVVDVKGVRTQVFTIKERLFRWRYPDVDFRVVST